MLPTDRTVIGRAKAPARERDLRAHDDEHIEDQYE
jgi:hypothetical protein